MSSRPPLCLSSSFWINFQTSGSASARERGFVAYCEITRVPRTELETNVLVQEDPWRESLAAVDVLSFIFLSLFVNTRKQAPLNAIQALISPSNFGLGKSARGFSAKEGVGLENVFASDASGVAPRSFCLGGFGRMYDSHSKPQRYFSILTQFFQCLLRSQMDISKAGAVIFC